MTKGFVVKKLPCKSSARLSGVGLLSHLPKHFDINRFIPVAGVGVFQMSFIIFVYFVCILKKNKVFAISTIAFFFVLNVCLKNKN